MSGMTEPSKMEPEEDHLVICPHCHEEMEPTVMLQYGVPSSSVCSLLQQNLPLLWVYRRHDRYLPRYSEKVLHKILAYIFREL